MRGTWRAGIPFAPVMLSDTGVSAAAAVAVAGVVSEASRHGGQPKTKLNGFYRKAAGQRWLGQLPGMLRATEALSMTNRKQLTDSVNRP